MQQPVKNLVQGNNSTLLLTHSPATQGKNALRKKNLERLRYFQPSDYSFESFMDMCEVFEPKWFRISSRTSSIAIQYAQTKEKAFFANGKTFSEAYEKLMKTIQAGGNTQEAISLQPIA
ncbi:hypothetical protein [Bergeyella zoohelcum]|uniref:hypothetical protein n=1 Tax=Bergeyella zoohelcum TaxID=1015 RepID=UPI000586EEF7|nr:hypothetical protein [Bergeyella zoohelcum]